MNDIYKMTLHSISNTWIGGDLIMILRVSGGWIYFLKQRPVFVPYHIEYINKSEEEDADQDSKRDGKRVFIVREKRWGVIFGCFDSLAKAEKYADDSTEFKIETLAVS